VNRKQRRAQDRLGPGQTSDTSAAAETLLAGAGAHHRAGKLADAERLCRSALQLQPRHAAGLHMLGVIRAQSGDADEAARLIERSLVIEPSNPAAQFNLGNALSALGRDEAAIAAYRRSQRGRPEFAQGWINLAAALARAGRWDEAADAWGRATALAPGHAVAHRGLADALGALGRHEAAAGAYQKALALDPADFAACCGLGQALQDAGRYDEAVAAFRRALGLRPPGVDAYIALAGSLRELGESADALAALDRALAIDPASARAWYVRSLVKTFSADDPDIGRMQALLARADARGLGDQDRLELEFALGKAWMDAGDADRAFDHLAAGNRRKRAGFAYDVQDDIDRLNGAAAAFSPELMRRLRGGGAPSERPVFIVGMPRSGSTLIEQILASHPDIHGAGELTLLDEALNRVLGPGAGRGDWAARAPKLNAGDLAAVGRAYVEGLATIAPGASRVVDKMPFNFRHAGLIAVALPNARIIHCRRDPIDTCLSCYAHNFVEGVDFAYDLRELGRYHLAYQRLMGHWRALLPAERFIEVDYEAVVGDLEREARRLIGFCGLAWDDACLAFHRTRRDIRTASAGQARQPIYRTSLERWKPYQAHLGPLIEALG
jgi:tetratricopeptide (TPR) repeat protein